MLQHAGHACANQLAATANVVLQFESNSIQSNVTQPRDDIRRHIESNAVAYDIGISWARKARVIGLPLSASSAFYVLMHMRGLSAHADKWLDGLVAGAGLPAGDSRLAIRNWLVNSRHQTSRSCLSVLIFGWNAYVSGRAVKQVRPWVKGTPYPSIAMIGTDPDGGPVEIIQ